MAILNDKKANSQLYEIISTIFVVTSIHFVIPEYIESTSKKVHLQNESAL